MSDCIFCKIANKEIPSEVVFEDERVLAFKDIHPLAPVHILIVPKKHYSTMNDLGPQDRDLAGYLLEVTAKIAKQVGVAEPGYRTVINTNAEAGQVVFHLHVHLLAGKRLSDDLMKVKKK